MRLSEYDFYGNDLFNTQCGSGNTYTAPDGSSYPCQNFEDCENVCSEYNTAVNGTSQQRCAAVSYAEFNNFCYAKYAINDCAPVTNSQVDGGLAIKAN